MPSNQNHGNVQTVEICRFYTISFVIIRGNSSTLFSTSFFPVVMPDVGCVFSYSLCINEKDNQGPYAAVANKARNGIISWAELRRLAS
jgi:hypothetical protein